MTETERARVDPPLQQFLASVDDLLTELADLRMTELRAGTRTDTNKLLKT